MSKITVSKREMNLTYNYTGEEYDINGTALSDLGGAVTSINMSIMDKDDQYVGSANAYVDMGGGKPKINISSVDTDIIVDVVAEVKDCIAQIKADVTAYNTKTTEE